VDIRSANRVGKYGVDTSVLDTLGVDAIQKSIVEQGIVVIDEIGPMEIMSGRFCQAVLHALKSDATVLGTVAKRSIPFADQIKSMPGVTVIEVRRENREGLLSDILDLLQEC
jgi:nucleoside-triphosphatase